MTVDEAMVSCENCVAACCKAPVFMQLSNREYKQHRTTMDLKIIVKPNKIEQRRTIQGGREVFLAVGDGLFELQSGCGNLTEDNRCSIHTFRPHCCREFEVGSAECLRLRRKAGLDSAGGRRRVAGR